MIAIAAANLIQIVFELGLFMRLYKSNSDSRVDKEGEKQDDGLDDPSIENKK